MDSFNSLLLNLIPVNISANKIYVNPHMNILSLANTQSHLCYSVSKCLLHKSEKSADPAYETTLKPSARYCGGRHEPMKSV